ncbi:MAG TPA: hypothetical protein VHC39_17560 [Rhizomicrobium sp.]|nr:hypothetical protein [Rhizomicrobium sp.]
MVGLEKEESAAGRSADELKLFARLLDPHMSASDHSEETKPNWSPRKTIAFIIVASLALWGAIIWAVSYLIRFF